MGFVYKEFTDDDFDYLREKIKGDVAQFQEEGVVDDEKNIYFVDLGEITIARENRNLSYFNLIWNDETIAIEAKPHFEGTPENTVYFFDIVELTVPETLNVDLEDIRHAIANAVEVYKKENLPGDYKVEVTLPTAINSD